MVQFKEEEEFAQSLAPQATPWHTAIIRMLMRMRISKRLALIVLIFSIPFTALTVWLITKSFNANIEFASQELRGTRFSDSVLKLQRELGALCIEVSAAKARTGTEGISEGSPGSGRGAPR